MFISSIKYSEFMGLGNMYDLKHSLLCTWLRYFYIYRLELVIEKDRLEFFATLIANGFSSSTPLSGSSNQLNFPFSMSLPLELTVFRHPYRSSLSTPVCRPSRCIKLLCVSNFYSYLELFLEHT